jgi:hypothetical protein
MKANEDSQHFNRTYLQQVLTITQYPLMVKINFIAACELIAVNLSQVEISKAGPLLQIVKYSFQISTQEPVLLSQIFNSTLTEVFITLAEVFYPD